MNQDAFPDADTDASMDAGLGGWTSPEQRDLGSVRVLIRIPLKCTDAGTANGMGGRTSRETH